MDSILKSLLDREKELTYKLEQTKRAISAMLGTTKKGNIDSLISITWEQRIISALKMLGRGSSNTDILRAILNEEPLVKTSDIKENLRSNLYKLTNSGKIMVEGKRRLYLYGLPEWFNNGMLINEYK